MPARNPPPPPSLVSRQVIGLDVDLGLENYGAIGIAARGAQGTSVQGVTVFARDGYAGLEGGAGSGGSHIAVTVIGGRFGVDFRAAQPAPTAAGFRLLDQQCGGILYCGLMSLSLVGLELRSSVASFTNAIVAGTGIPLSDDAGSPACRPPPGPSGWCEQQVKANKAAIHSQISIVDSVISGPADGGGGVAVLTSSNMLYCKNVFVRGYGTLATFTRSNHSFPLPPKDPARPWAVVHEFAHGEPPLPLQFKKRLLQLQAPIIVDGERRSDLVNISVATAPPDDLRSRHGYGPEEQFPSFATAGAIDATLPPYSARGDAVHDDAPAINRALAAAAGRVASGQRGVVFLPKGVYRLGATLQVAQGVALVGIAHRLCVLLPARGWPGEGEEVLPLVHLHGPPSASADDLPGSTLANIMMATFKHTPRVMAFRWDAEGRNNILRQCATRMVMNLICEEALPPDRCPTPSLHRHAGPMTEVRGSGRFFVVHHEDGYYEAPGYRHLLVSGEGRRSFYHLNAEHAQSDANVEIRDGGGVQIYGR